MAKWFEYIADLEKPISSKIESSLMPEWANKFVQQTPVINDMASRGWMGSLPQRMSGEEGENAYNNSKTTKGLKIAGSIAAIIGGAIGLGSIGGAGASGSVSGGGGGGGGLASSFGASQAGSSALGSPVAFGGTNYMLTGSGGGLTAAPIGGGGFGGTVASGAAGGGGLMGMIGNLFGGNGTSGNSGGDIKSQITNKVMGRMLEGRGDQSKEIEADFPTVNADYSSAPLTAVSNPLAMAGSQISPMELELRRRMLAGGGY